MKRLKQLRGDRKLTQKEIADFLGIDRTTYVKYETGVSEPNFGILKKLSYYFDVSIDYLLENNPNKMPTVEEKSLEYQPLITAYKNADEGTRRAVNKLLDLEPKE